MKEIFWHSLCLKQEASKYFILRYQSGKKSAKSAKKESNESVLG